MSPVTIRPDIVIEIASNQGVLGMCALHYSDLDRLGIHGAEAVREHIIRLIGGAYGLPAGELAKLDTALTAIAQRQALQVKVGAAPVTRARTRNEEPLSGGNSGVGDELQLKLQRALEARDKAGRALQEAQEDRVAALAERDMARNEVDRLLKAIAEDAARRSTAKDDHQRLTAEVEKLSAEIARQQVMIGEYRTKLAECEGLIAMNAKLAGDDGEVGPFADDDESDPGWGPAEDDWSGA